MPEPAQPLDAVPGRVAGNEDASGHADRGASDPVHRQGALPPQHGTSPGTVGPWGDPTRRHEGGPSPPCLILVRLPVMIHPACSQRNSRRRIGETIVPMRSRRRAALAARLARNGSVRVSFAVGATATVIHQAFPELAAGPRLPAMTEAACRGGATS